VSDGGAGDAALTALERAVLERILAGEDARCAALRRQLEACTVRERELTGVGSFTRLHVPPEVPRLVPPASFPIGDLEARIPGLARGAGFVLFVQDGALDLLEAYTYDEPWPPGDIASFSLEG
jgi:hypothetical protein